MNHGLTLDLFTNKAGEGMATLEFSVSRTRLVEDDEWDIAETEMLKEIIEEAKAKLAYIEDQTPAAKRIYEHGIWF